MTSVIFTKNDAVAQTNFIPGKIYKYYYRAFYSGRTSKVITRKVRVVKEYPYFILLDFGKYKRTVHKIDLLTGKALLK